MPQVLIVDDEPYIVDVLQIALRRDGFTDVVSAATGKEAMAAAARGPLGAVILDIGLPDTSGFDLAVAIRRARPDVPIVFLTARDSDADKLMGFGVGGDDYVVKPFNPLEVVARIRALMRRAYAQGEGAHAVYDFGRFEVRPEEGRLLVEGKDVQLPAREFQLLCYLAKHRSTVFSASELYRAVWGDEPLGITDQNTVSVHVHRLREKIEPHSGSPQYLVTVRGLGYKLVQPNDAQTDEAASV
jgi:two-component system response regulator RegX3